MKKNKFIAIVITLSAAFTTSFGQDSRTDNHTVTVAIPNIAILDLEAGTKNFTSTFSMPGAAAEAGEKINVPAANNDLWLNYTSILPSTGVASRRVDVKADVLVPGVNIKLVAGAITTGAGTRGTPTAGITLSTTDQPLVTGIGSGYTNTGVNNGHQLTYTYEALDGNFSAIRANNHTVTVTYTLVDVI